RIEPAELRAPDGGLDLVEAQVEPDLRVNVFVEAAMISQPPAACGDLVVVGHHRATVAHHGEILGRIEGKDARAAEAPDLSAAPLGPLSLPAALEEAHAEARRQLTDGIEVDRLPIEMDRKQPDGARGRLGGRVTRVHRVVTVDVDKDGCGAGEAYGFDGGECSMRRHKN